jgi:uncharacterized membrane protein YecN with MAPEG domain
MQISGQGSSVKINSIGRVTIGDYVKNNDITAAETLTDTQRILLIDQAKFFNFQIDDVDKAQQTPKLMDGAMAESGYALGDVTDKFLAGLYTGVQAANIVGLGNDTTPIVPTKANAYDYLVTMKVLLDEANVPQMGRWVVVPAWFYGLMLTDARFIQATAVGDNRVANGMIGSAAGFSVYSSNNVPNTTATKYKIIAGHPMAMSYAEQIVSVEAYRPQNRFADAVKGLHVYGGKLVRPEGIAVATFNRV